MSDPLSDLHTFYRRVKTAIEQENRAYLDGTIYKNLAQICDRLFCEIVELPDMAIMFSLV